MNLSIKRLIDWLIGCKSHSVKYMNWGSRPKSDMYSITSDDADTVVDEVTMVTLCMQLHHGRWTWLLRRIHRAWCEWRGSHQHSREVQWLRSSTSSAGTRTMMMAAGLKGELKPAVDLTGSRQGHCKDILMTSSTFSCPVYSPLAPTTSGSASNLI